MTEKIITPKLRTAAKIAFIRTAGQSLTAVLPVGAITVVVTGEWLLAAVLGAAGAVVTAGLAGSVAAWDIIRRGLPDEYVYAGIEQERGDVAS